MNINALDSSLEGFAGKDQEVSITLRDNSTVVGKVKSFDAYIILLADGPGTMVYRHSILKLSEKLPEQKTAPAPKPMPERPVSQGRPPSMRRPANRPAQRPEMASAPQARPKEAALDKPLGTMGEAMLKWLKSQKGK